MGYSNTAVVREREARAYDRHLRDCTGIALSLDEIPYLEWLESQDEQASGKILEGTAHGHTYSHAATGEESCKRSRINAQCANCQHN